MKIPRGVQVVECKSLEFPGKDIVVVKYWEDFVYVLGPVPVIYKLKNVYYNISDSVAFVYEDEGHKE